MSEDPQRDTQEATHTAESATLKIRTSSTFFTVADEHPDSTSPSTSQSSTSSPFTDQRSSSDAPSDSPDLAMPPTHPPSASPEVDQVQRPQDMLDTQSTKPPAKDKPFNRTPYRALLTLLVLAHGALSYLVLNGWAWSPVSTPITPSPTIGLEQVRASLFGQGLMLTEGYSNLILGPLISQMLWLGDVLEQLSASLTQYPWFTSRVILSMLSLTGMMWGCSLLFKRRVLTVSAGLIASAAIIAALLSAGEALWMLTVYTWIGVGFTASWRHSASGRWAALCGFTLSIGIAATPLFVPLAILYVLLTLWPLPLGPHVPWWRAIAWRTPIGALIGLGVGLSPWLFRGQLSHPPITLEQYASPSIWITLWERLDLWYILEETQSAFAPLWVMAALTFMSSHTSGAPWSRRGIGIAGLLTLSLIYAPLLGVALVIPPLVWIVVHPWSPLGTFTLLSFRPVFKRVISLVIFAFTLLIPTTHAFQQFQSRQTALNTPASRELNLIADELNGRRGLKSIWALGREAHPLYAMTGLSASALLPLDLEPIRLSHTPQVAADEKVDVIVIGASADQVMAKNSFRELLKRQYRLIPASDYLWLQQSRLKVYLRSAVTTTRAQVNPSARNGLQPRKSTSIPTPADPSSIQTKPLDLSPSSSTTPSKSSEARSADTRPQSTPQRGVVQPPPIKTPQALPVKALPHPKETSDNQVTSAAQASSDSPEAQPTAGSTQTASDKRQVKSNGHQRQPKKSKARPKKSKTQPKKSKAQPKKSKAQPKKSKAQPKKSKAQPRSAPK